MKKIIIPFLALGLFVACGNEDTSKKSETTEASTTTATTDLSKNPDYEKGLSLIGENDCLTCHKIDEKLTGPSYRDVANKYASMPDTIVQHLAGKIINGGNGVWGDVYMLPHSGLSQEDAEAMVKYVLLLKK